MPKPPNLLFILTDQQRFDTMRCYGNELIDTPNLDRLAHESFVFENAYVSQPVCTPSRATILTGLYPHTTGLLACNIALPPEIPTIAELAPEEYRCAYMGKWHLGDEIFPQHGFKTRVSTEDAYRRFFSKPEYFSHLSDYHHFLVANGLTPDSESMGQRVFSRHMAASLEESLTKAAFLGERAAQFIKENREQPFVLFIGFLEPHPPHTGPFNDMYDPGALPVGAAFMRRPANDAPLLHRVMSAYYMESEEYGYDLRTEEGWRAIRARYWGNISLVDRAVGRILGALSEEGLENDTIVVFTSEHGEMLGDHGILGKTVLYEEAVKVPMLIRAPALGRRHRMIPGRFSHIDLLPTLLDLMAIPMPGKLQGESRVSAPRGDASLGSDVFIEWNRSDGHPMPGEAEVNRAMISPWRTVITGDGWKLNLSANDQCQLYDLKSDPAELVNLYDEPRYRARALDLGSRIHEWQERTDDDIPLPWM